MRTGYSEASCERIVITSYSIHYTKLYDPSVLQTNLQAQSVPQVSSQSKGMSIVQELTQGLATDKTKPSTSSVKVSQVLDSDGLNLNPWLYDLVNCGITKECIEAFQHPMPYTKANSAALHLLLSSIPKEFGYHVARNNFV